MQLSISHQGIKLLEQREGDRLKAYRDQRGIWTIGVGHSSLAGTGPSVRPGQSITEDQALRILSGDLVPREAFLNRLLKRQPTQNEFDAMVSLMFNIGDGAFQHSEVLSLFNAGQSHAAAQAFMHFCKPASLEGRRISEKHQFLS